MARNALGPFEFQLLAVLAECPGNCYGISIMEQIRERTGRAPNLGAVYKGLDRLREKGLITAWWGEPTKTRGGRRKRYYKIEAPGREALRQSYETVAAFNPVFGMGGA